MSYGIQITNINNDVVVDGDFRNHAVIHAGSVTLNGNNPPNGFSIFSRTAKVVLPTPIDMSRGPLIWGRIGIVDAYVGLVGMEINASNQLVGFWVAGEYSTLIALNNIFHTVEWRVTALPTGGGGQNWGMQIFNLSGSLVFDSGFNYIDIVAVGSPVIVQDWPPTFVTYSSLANPWYCLSSICYLEAGSPTDNQFWFANMYALHSNTQSKTRLTQYAFDSQFIYQIGGGNYLATAVIGK